MKNYYGIEEPIGIREKYDLALEYNLLPTIIKNGEMQYKYSNIKEAKTKYKEFFDNIKDNDPLNIGIQIDYDLDIIVVETKNMDYKEFEKILDIKTLNYEYNLGKYYIFRKSKSDIDNILFDDLKLYSNDDVRLIINDSFIYWIGSKIDNFTYSLPETKEKLEINQMNAKTISKFLSQKTSFDFKQYSKLFEDHEGQGRLFAELFKNDCKIVDLKKNIIYIWNEKELLWKRENSLECISSRITNIMKSFSISLRDNFTLLSSKLIEKHPKYRENAKILNIYQQIIKNINYLIKFSNNYFHRVINIKNILYCAKEYLKDESFIHKLDKNRNLFPVADGMVVDFTIKRCRKRVREDYLTIASDVIFNSNVKSKIARNFLDDVFLNNEDLTYLIEEIFGTTLTGFVHEKLFIMYNTNGSNGKTTLMNFLGEVLGPFYIQVNNSVYLKNNFVSSGPTPFIMALDHKRAAVISELGENDMMNEEFIKSITGKEKISARNCGSDATIIIPEFKPFIITNNKPICSQDNALWRRLMYIPFSASFVDEPKQSHERKRIPNMEEKLRDPDVKSEFLNILINGQIRFQENNYQFLIPEEVKDATIESRLEQNTILKYIDDALLESKGNSIGAMDIYNNYKTYCQMYSLKILSQKVFGLTLKTKLQYEMKGNKVYYLNIISSIV